MEVRPSITGHLVINFLGFQVELRQVSTNTIQIEEVTVKHQQIKTELRINQSELPAMFPMDTAYQIQTFMLIL